MIRVCVPTLIAAAIVVLIIIGAVRAGIVLGALNADSLPTILITENELGVCSEDSLSYPKWHSLGWVPAFGARLLACELDDVSLRDVLEFRMNIL